MPLIAAAKSLVLSSAIASWASVGGGGRGGGGVTAVAADVLSSVSSPSASSSSSILQSLSRNAPVVGAAWVVSSAILTTYSTTLFLKFPQGNEQDHISATRPRPPSNLHPTRQNLSLPSRTKRPLSSLVPDFSSSSSISTVPIRAAALLQTVPRATLLTLFRFAGSLLLGLLVHLDYRHVASRISETRQWIPSFVVPAALLFVANYSNSISLNRIGISLTYTSKCGIPLMTVLLTVLWEGRHALPNWYALLSLLPIATGIALASWSAPSFELPGFVAAVVSTTAQSALNVSSKRVMSKTHVSGPVAQRCMVAIGLLLTVAVSLGQELHRRFFSSAAPDTDTRMATKADRMEEGIKQSSAGEATPTLPPVWLIVLAFASYHMEYVLSFTFVRLVPSVTYGTLDAVRRLGIILAGRAMFGGAPLTTTNKSGIALALLGALSYSIATST